MIPVLPPPSLTSEFIYERAPFSSCHASTVVQTASGAILAAWFGGTAESAPDVAIYLARKNANGWTAPERVADAGANRGCSCYNPVLFQPLHGPLLLFYKVGKGPQTWWGMLTSSKDDGKSWSAPVRLPNGIFGPIKNKPIELGDGTILCGSSEESKGWTVHFEATKDFGKTWRRTEPLNNPKDIGAIQPSLLPLGNASVRAIGRTREGRLFLIDSVDDGRTWGAMRLSELPNPNSGTDAVRMEDGRFVLVYNDSTSARSPLSVAVSGDAEHWKKVFDLETAPGEYSYPAVIQSRDGRVHITYTWQRRRVKYASLDPKDLP